MTFLIHPEHGATNAPDSDVEALKKAGWHVSNHAFWLSLKGKAFVAPKDETDTGSKAKAEPKPSEAAEEQPVVVQPVAKKGGRPRKSV